jgi:hypothetical protein
MSQARWPSPWFWLWLAAAVLLFLFSVYYYRYQVPDPESIAPLGDRTDSDLRFAAWYALIAAASLAAIAAIVSLVRSLRRSGKPVLSALRVENTSAAKRDRLWWFWAWLAAALLLTLFCVYFYRYQVPSPESIAPGGDRSDSDFRFALWYGFIAVAGLAAIAAVVTLVRGFRKR